MDPEALGRFVEDHRAVARREAEESRRQGHAPADAGHLLFWRDGTLMAQAFDANARQVQGQPLALPSAGG